MANEINPQRSRNFWEPVYEPYIGAFENWNDRDKLHQTNGLNRVIVDPDLLTNNDFRIQGKKFTHCDFIGKLDSNQKVFTVEDCEFDYCSFRMAEFINIKFRRCKFTNTTFSLGKYESCEFRDCKYLRIGASGNEMDFDNCFLDPSLFLKNLYLNTDEATLNERGTSVEFQRMRQFKTKSVIARKFSEMDALKGDITYHILSIKTARCYEMIAGITQALYYVRFGSFRQIVTNVFPLVFALFEYPVIRVFGWLSGWGYQIGKSIFFGLLALCIFSSIYQFYIFKDHSYASNLLKAFEYWLLVGYTKYDLNSLNITQKWIVFANSGFGTFWLGATIPIVLNKLGKNNE